MVSINDNLVRNSFRTACEGEGGGEGNAPTHVFDVGEGESSKAAEHHQQRNVFISLTSRIERSALDCLRSLGLSVSLPFNSGLRLLKLTKSSSVPR